MVRCPSSVKLILTKSFPWYKVDQADNPSSKQKEGIYVMKYYRERTITEGLCIVEYISGSHKATHFRDTCDTLKVRPKCVDMFQGNNAVESICSDSNLENIVRTKGLRNYIVSKEQTRIFLLCGPTTRTTSPSVAISVRAIKESLLLSVASTVLIRARSIDVHIYFGQRHACNSWSLSRPNSVDVSR